VEKAFLVAHSMGYGVARRFIEKYPQRCAGLCIVDGAYFRVPADPEELLEWTRQNEDFLHAFKSGDRNAFIDHFLESLYVEETSEALKNEIKATVLQTPDYVGNSAMEEMVKPENWKEFPMMVPTLAVYAVSEDLPEDNEAYLRTLFPNMEYHCWDRIGHFIMMEQPEKFNRLLERYLKTQLSP
jgi:pimeloyl-ACP methyl ester carboxylesterase